MLWLWLWLFCRRCAGLFKSPVIVALCLSEEQLASLVTRDSMIGTGLAKRPDAA